MKKKMTSFGGNHTLNISFCLGVNLLMNFTQVPVIACTCIGARKDNSYKNCNLEGVIFLQ